MPQSFGQNWQDVNDAALGPIGSAAREANSAILARLSQHVDSPLRMFATFPTADAKLNFAANRTVSGDGTSKSTPAIDDLISSFVASTLNLQSGATTGGTFYRNGVAFTMPTVVSGNYYRVAFMYRSDNIIDMKFSPDGFASWAAMDAATSANPGTLFAALDGIPIGWIDLIATSTSAFKTASSAGVSATSIIENTVSSVTTIYRIAAGGGAGGGSDRTFKLGSFSSTGATMKGGYAYIDDSRVVSSGSGTTSLTTGIDQIINFNNVLTASSLAAIGTLNSAAAKLLALVLDLTTLSSVTSLTDNKRKVYTFAEANLKFIDQADLTLIDPRRYVLLDQVLLPITVSSWATATGISKPIRVHDTLASYFPYVQRYATQITSASATNVLTHGLDAEPQIVQVFYYDGTNKNGKDLSSHVYNKTATQLGVSSFGLTFGGGQYLEVTALWIPTNPNIASSSRTFTSQWFTSNAVTTVAHGLSDMEDIRGLQVQEWDTVAAKRRVIDTSALIVNFDATNVYLNWTGLVPSATLQYRFFVGGSPIPWSINDGAFDTITNRSGAGAPNFPNGATGITTGINSTPIVYRLTKQAIGSQGNSGQVAAGHILTAKSWPLTIGPTVYSNWLSHLPTTDLTDGSGNARTLTDEGTVLFTGTDIFGTARAATFNGTTQSLKLTSTFVNGSGGVIGYGGWFKLNDWTPGARTILMSVSDTAVGDRNMIAVETTGQISAEVTDSVGSRQVFIPSPGFSDGSYHWIAMRANGSTLDLFVDGRMVASLATTAIATTANAMLRISGRNNTLSGPLAGVAHDCFFWNFAAKDEDYRKLFSYRLDHAAGVSLSNQKWSVGFYGSSLNDEDQTATGWMVDKYDTNTLFVDFSDRASTDQVEMFLENRSLSPTTVGSNVPFDTIYSANPTFPIAHGQTGVPELIGQGELSSGVWEGINLTGQVTADSTNLVSGSTLASFFTAGYLRVRLVARNVGPVQTGVPQATTGLDGLVAKRSSGQQKWGGLKGNLDGSYSVGNIRDPEGAGTTTLSDDDRREQTFNLTAARTCLLPSVSILKGDVWRIENRAAFALTLQSSAGNTLTSPYSTVFQIGYAVVRALQDAPTAAAHWQVIHVEEQGTWTPTITDTDNSFGTVTYDTNRFGEYERVNNVVTLRGIVGWTNTSGVPTGSILQIASIPFAAATSNKYYLNINEISNIDIPASVLWITGNAQTTSKINIEGSKDNTGAVNVTGGGNGGVATRYIGFEGRYRI